MVDGFDATWAKARETFGKGTPRGGEFLDRSLTLRELQSNVDAAKPKGHWSGSASESYATANAKQGRVLGEMANLDQRLRAEVDRSAVVVSAGRRDLEAVRQWVHDAAASVPNPNSARGQQMLTPIVRKGSAAIAEIVRRTNSEANAIAGRIRGIDSEFRMLGGDLKLGDGNKTTDDGPQMATGGEQDEWRYPWGPPPPPDSAPGGGRWELGRGYPPGPDGGPPVGPDNPRLTMYIPNPYGGQVVLDPNRPGASAG